MTSHKRKCYATLTIVNQGKDQEHHSLQMQIEPTKDYIILHTDSTSDMPHDGRQLNATFFNHINKFDSCHLATNAEFFDSDDNAIQVLHYDAKEAFDHQHIDVHLNGKEEHIGYGLVNKIEDKELESYDELVKKQVIDSNKIRTNLETKDENKDPNEFVEQEQVPNDLFFKDAKENVVMKIKHHLQMDQKIEERYDKDKVLDKIIEEMLAEANEQIQEKHSVLEKTNTPIEEKDFFQIMLKREIKGNYRRIENLSDTFSNDDSFGIYQQPLIAFDSSETKDIKFQELDEAIAVENIYIKGPVGQGPVLLTVHDYEELILNCQDLLNSMVDNVSSQNFYSNPEVDDERYEQLISRPSDKKNQSLWDDSPVKVILKSYLPVKQLESTLDRYSEQVEVMETNENSKYLNSGVNDDINRKKEVGDEDENKILMELFDKDDFAIRQPKTLDKDVTKMLKDKANKANVSIEIPSPSTNANTNTVSIEVQNEPFRYEDTSIKIVCKRPEIFKPLNTEPVSIKFSSVAFNCDDRLQTQKNVKNHLVDCGELVNKELENFDGANMDYESAIKHLLEENLSLNKTNKELQEKLQQLNNFDEETQLVNDTLNGVDSSDLQKEKSSTPNKPPEHTRKDFQKTLVEKNVYEKEIDDYSYKNEHDGESQHQNLHLLRFGCLLCPEKFIREYDLLRHMKMHSDEKPFECEKCGFRYRRKCDLNKHMEKHGTGKKFFCEICGKAFTRRSHVKRHFLSHSGEKPYECTICDKKFSRRYQLTKHYESHYVNMDRTYL